MLDIEARVLIGWYSLASQSERVPTRCFYVKVAFLWYGEYIFTRMWLTSIPSWIASIATRAFISGSLAATRNALAPRAWPMWPRHNAATSNLLVFTHIFAIFSQTVSLRVYSKFQFQKGDMMYSCHIKILRARPLSKYINMCEFQLERLNFSASTIIIRRRSREFLRFPNVVHRFFWCVLILIQGAIKW